MTDFDVSCQLETSLGVFLELEDQVNGYFLGGNAFSDRTKSFKQLKAGEDQPWLRGEVVRLSAPSNVTELLEVFVTGLDHYTFDYRVQLVEKALTEQMSYRIIRRIENSKITYTCMPVEQLQIQTQREYLWATTGMISVQVPRRPDVLLEEVTP